LPAVILLALLAVSVRAETLARYGDGWLETVDGCLVLHVKGSPHDMGLQHGKLLRDHVRENVRFILQEKGNATLVKLGGLEITPANVLESVVELQRPHVPKKYWQEMQGVAQGAGVPLEQIEAANFIPELFHCSGFAVMNAATADGTFYHGRVLDYGVDLRLQQHAVLIVQEPTGGIPFVNVGYAGFIGSVTGMNAQHVSIGEMGGGGQGQWNGTPMALLVREVLEAANDLDAGVEVFRSHKRTCEYYYVLADGNTNRAVGLAATPRELQVVHTGEAVPQLPTPVKDAVLLSAGTRYPELVRRVQAQHGRLDAQAAIRLMDRPVAMSHNLHNALFEPKSTRFWVANADKEGHPAAQQKYHAFQLNELLARRPAEVQIRAAAAAR
jgi:predicted choloylglycine hydrolase